MQPQGKSDKEARAKFVAKLDLNRIKPKAAKGTATPETPAPNPPAPQSAPETTTQNPHP